MIDLKFFLGGYQPRKLSQLHFDRLESFSWWISTQKVKSWHFDQLEFFSGWISTQKAKSLAFWSTLIFFWVDIQPENYVIGILIDLNHILGGYPPRKLSHWHFDQLEFFSGWISAQKVKSLAFWSTWIFFWVEIHPEN